MSAEAFKSRIGSALANRDFGEVEAAWREFASMDPEAYPYLLNIGNQLMRHDKGALAASSASRSRSRCSRRRTWTAPWKRRAPRSRRASEPKGSATC